MKQKIKTNKLDLKKEFETNNKFGGADIYLRDLVLKFNKEEKNESNLKDLLIKNNYTIIAILNEKTFDKFKLNKSAYLVYSNDSGVFSLIHDEKYETLTILFNDIEQEKK